LIKVFLFILLLISFLNADKVLVKSFACKTMDALQKAPVDEDDYLNLNMYAIAHDCIILSKNSQIQVLGYDPRNSQDIYVQIVDKRTGFSFYVRKSKIQIEQGGKKASYRF